MVISCIFSIFWHFLTMSGPQLVPSAAGMNLVSHRWPVRWHHRDLQMSCQTSQHMQSFRILMSSIMTVNNNFSSCSSSFSRQQLLRIRTTITLVDQPQLPCNPGGYQEAFLQSLSVKSNHCTALIKRAIIVSVIWPKNEETEQAGGRESLWQTGGRVWRPAWQQLATREKPEEGKGRSDKLCVFACVRACISLCLRAGAPLWQQVVDSHTA